MNDDGEETRQYEEFMSKLLQLVKRNCIDKQAKKMRLNTASGNLLMQYMAAICSPANIAIAYNIISDYLFMENALLTASDMME